MNDLYPVMILIPAGNAWDEKYEFE